MSALSSLLVQDQVLSVTHVEQILQRQVIYGGDLATNLLEMNLVDEVILAQYLGRVVRLPVFPAEYLLDAQPEAVKMLPWKIADERRILPVRLEGDTLVVATAGPVPKGALDEISFLLGVKLSVHLVLEFRLAMALLKFYGIPMTARMETLQRKLAPEFSVDGPPIVGPPRASSGLVSKESPAPTASVAGNVPSDESWVSPSTPGSREEVLVIESSHGERESEESTKRFITGARENTERFAAMEKAASKVAEAKAVEAELQEPAPSKEVAQTASEPPSVMTSVPATSSFTPLSFSSAATMLEEAEDRDAILDIFFRFASQAFRFSLLFVVQGKTAQGKTLVERGEAPKPADRVSVSLDSGGMFETVFLTRGFHLGPATGASSDSVFLESIGRQAPKSCAVVPISLRGRVILLLYGDSGTDGVRANRITRLAEFGRLVASSFERILLKQKYGQYEKARSSGLNLGVGGKVAPEISKKLSRKKDFSGWGGTRGAVGTEDLQEAISEEAWPEPQGFTKAPIEEETTLPSEPPSTVPAGPIAEKRALAHDKNSAQPVPVVMIRPADMNVPIGPTGSDKAGSDEAGAQSQRAKADTEPPASPKEMAPVPDPSPDLVRRVEIIDTRSTAPATPAYEDPQRFESPKRFIDLESQEKTLVPEPVAPSAPPSEPPATVNIEEETVSPEPMAPPEPPAPEESQVQSPEPVAVSGSVRVDMREEIERLVERVMSRGPYDEAAAELLVGMGDDALRTLIRHFPGPLNFDRYQESSRLRRVGQHGHLLRLFVEFGKAAGAHVVPLLESLDSEVRFYAVFLFSELGYPEALSALAERTFDNDRQIRAVAVDVMREYGGYPEYRWAAQDVAGVLSSATSNLDRKRRAAEVLGHLRDPVAIPALAEMLGSVDGVLAERCQKALVKITFTDFGFSERRWLSWWESNRSHHRIEWAIASLNHRVESIRRNAIDELRYMVDGAIDWPRGPMDHKLRKELKRRCLQWWDREGRALNPVMDIS